MNGAALSTRISCRLKARRLLLCIHRRARDSTVYPARVEADGPFSLAQDLLSAADPDFGRKGLDISLFQRRFETITPITPILVNGLEFQEIHPSFTVAHEAGAIECPQVWDVVAALRDALTWNIDSSDEFELLVRSVDLDPTATAIAGDHPGVSSAQPSARAARWFNDPTREEIPEYRIVWTDWSHRRDEEDDEVFPKPEESHRFKTLHTQAGVWGRGPIPDVVLTISVTGSEDQAWEWESIRQKNEKEYQADLEVHLESLARSEATRSACKSAKTPSSKNVRFSIQDDAEDDGPSAN
jgi:hypothetical protein